MGNLDELTQQVLELPLEQRSKLAEKLLESLDELAPEELKHLPLSALGFLFKRST